MTFSYSKKKCEEFYLEASKGNLQGVQALSFDLGVDLNFRDEARGRMSQTPLFAACSNGHVDVVRYLLEFRERTIDFNLPRGDGVTPFSIACQNAHQKVVELLLANRGIDVNKEDNYQRTPLSWVVTKSHVEMAKVLLASRREIEFFWGDQNWRRTAVEFAKRRADPRDVRILLGRKSQMVSSLPMVTLMDSYAKDPHEVKTQLRRQLGYDGKSFSFGSFGAFFTNFFFFLVLLSSAEALAGEIFALVIYVTDGYMMIPKYPVEDADSWRSKTKRFLEVAMRLPLDLQMVLCNRAIGLGHSIVKRVHSEKGFKKFAELL